jgi:deoxyribose-phosphate aldolase
VKTSTGFAPKGATIDDLALMRSAVSPKVQVKASGGVRSLDAMIAMAGVGVTRFGTSATTEILQDLARRQVSVPGGRAQILRAACRTWSAARSRSPAVAPRSSGLYGALC